MPKYSWVWSLLWNMVELLGATPVKETDSFSQQLLAANTSSARGRDLLPSMHLPGLLTHLNFVGNACCWFSFFVIKKKGLVERIEKQFS